MKPIPSTGTLALKALDDDPEIAKLMLEIRRKHGLEKASLLVQGAIERSLSTSALTTEYGEQRPGGVDFFKFELHRIVDKE